MMSRSDYLEAGLAARVQRRRQMFVTIVLVCWVLLGMFVAPMVYVGTVISYAASCDPCHDPQPWMFALSVLLHLGLMLAYVQWRHERASAWEWGFMGVLWAVVPTVTVVLLPFFMMG